MTLSKESSSLHPGTLAFLYFNFNIHVDNELTQCLSERIVISAWFSEIRETRKLGSPENIQLALPTLFQPRIISSFVSGFHCFSLFVSLRGMVRLLTWAWQSTCATLGEICVKIWMSRPACGGLTLVQGKLALRLNGGLPSETR